MEMMPFHTDDARLRYDDVASLPTFGPAAQPDWRDGLPALEGLGFTLREMHAADAPTLFAHLTTEQVTRFISPPPTSVAGFEKFIAWAHRERGAGRYACFAVVPDGETTAVGLFQLRVLDRTDGIAEWGFILGAAYWGTGLFLAGAQRVVDFAFGAMGLRRLEARAAVTNGRGNGALQKLGAVPEARLRQSFDRHGERHDQILWGILRDDWWATRSVRQHTIH